MDENNTIENQVEETSDTNVNPVEDAPDTQEEVQPAPRENTQEINMRELRNAKERAEKERAILAEKLRHYENQKAEATKQPEETYGDDDFVEGKHLKKEIDSVRKQLKNYESQVAVQADESRLKSKYSDFSKVVTQEAIDKLREQDPEFAETIALSKSSLYSRGSLTYKRIKDLGIYVEDTHKNERELAQKNAMKPKSVNSVSPQRGDSPLSVANAFANGLTPDLKRQLWKEMQEAAKRH